MLKVFYTYWGKNATVRKNKGMISKNVRIKKKEAG